MVKEITLEFPEFITHVTISKNKWKKIGYNAIYMCPHFHVREKFTSSIHSYINKYLPKDLIIEGPVTTEVIIYAPRNYGNVKSLINKLTGQRQLSWKCPTENYVPNWDIFNLAAVWIKSLDDAIVRAGILPDDNINYVNGFSGRFIEIENFKDRKIIYIIKKI